MKLKYLITKYDLLPIYVDFFSKEKVLLIDVETKEKQIIGLNEFINKYKNYLLVMVSSGLVENKNYIYLPINEYVYDNYISNHKRDCFLINKNNATLAIKKSFTKHSRSEEVFVFYKNV